MSGNIFAVGRMLFSALLAAGGIVAIWFGYKLFLQGSGLHKGVDKLEVPSGMRLEFGWRVLRVT
jgi:hypothetical protein